MSRAFVASATGAVDWKQKNGRQAKGGRFKKAGSKANTHTY
jgi:hypothetical protein